MRFYNCDVSQMSAEILGDLFALRFYFIFFFIYTEYIRMASSDFKCSIRMSLSRGMFPLVQVSSNGDESNMNTKNVPSLAATNWNKNESNEAALGKQSWTPEDLSDVETSIIHVRQREKLTRCKRSFSEAERKAWLGSCLLQFCFSKPWVY